MSNKYYLVKAQMFICQLWPECI